MKGNAFIESKRIQSTSYNTKRPCWQLRKHRLHENWPRTSVVPDWRGQTSKTPTIFGICWQWMHKGWSRNRLCDLPGGKAKKNEIGFSITWFYKFMDRWPELRVVEPSSLSELSAKIAFETSICSYFLESILNKYSLKDKPHLINLQHWCKRFRYRV